MRRLELRPSDIGGSMKDLALQIAEVDHVEVDEADRSDSGGCKVERGRRPEPSCADAKHASGFQLLLPLQPDFRHDQMTAVAADLVMRKGDRRTAGDRWDDADRV